MNDIPGCEYKPVLCLKRHLISEIYWFTVTPLFFKKTNNQPLLPSIDPPFHHFKCGNCSYCKFTCIIKECSNPVDGSQYELRNLTTRNSKIWNQVPCNKFCVGKTSRCLKTHFGKNRSTPGFAFYWIQTYMDIIFWTIQKIPGQNDNLLMRKECEWILRLKFLVPHWFNEA